MVNTPDQQPLGLGGAVRLLRSLRGLTQESLALAADLDESYLSTIESGRRVPAARARAKLEVALGLGDGDLDRLGMLTPAAAVRRLVR